MHRNLKTKYFNYPVFSHFYIISNSNQIIVVTCGQLIMNEVVEKVESRKIIHPSFFSSS